MTTHAAMAVPRQPFSPLHSPRLQHLLSSKNRQNGASPLSSDNNKLKPSSPAPVKTPTTTRLNPPTKRRLEVDDDDSENYDSENIDPSSFSTSSKRSKTNDSTPIKISSSPSQFSLISTPSFSLAKPALPASMPPPSAISNRLHLTPRRSNAKANVSSPRAPLTAPAGRSPKSRHAGVSKNRRISAPFSRIDPPSFSRSSTASALPFSLDAALAGTLPSAKPKPAPVQETKTIAETMPSDWFFDIHEDSPDEEAANLMEHSTLTLDLSSDDETSAKNREREDRGKENVAPEDGSLSDFPSSSPLPSTRGSAARTTTRRRKIVKIDVMDDGERSPLSDLETEDFFAAGLDKDSVVVIPAFEDAVRAATAPLEETVVETVQEEDNKVDAPVPAQAEMEESGHELPVVAVEGEILIWEDDA